MSNSAQRKSVQTPVQKGWRDINVAGIVKAPGNSVEYETGSWRSSRPVRDVARCNNCLLCWVFCPDGAIEVQDAKMTGIDYKHCKGCGVCFTECPRDAIAMVDETKARVEASK